jgi:predicted DNA-binding mobile mystery protein A
MEIPARVMMRRHLDQRLSQAQPFKALQPPKEGWIRAIRQALGMTATDLAKKLNLSSPNRIYALEQGEVSGGTTLKSLRRAAEALNCTLVYALVPNDSLDRTVQAQARRLAERRVGRVSQTMRLERQQTSPSATHDLVERLTEEYARRPPKRFWSNG